MTRVVVLAGEGLSTTLVVNALTRRFSPLRVIIENPEKTSLFLRRRLRRLGALTVLGQVLFALYGKWQAPKAAPRIDAIIREHRLDSTPLPSEIISRVPSVNCSRTIELLRSLEPCVVVINGTRIIAKRVLESLPVPFINMHAGITPAYRGVHGAYWALVNADPQNCGVTVHLVDAGIDTGAVLYQARICPTRDDNFFTYPFLQLAAGIPLMTAAVEDALAGRLKPRSVDLPSKLWTHPTLWRYFHERWRSGLK